MSTEGEGSKPARRVLVAEDQAIVAMAIQDELTDAGFEVAGPFGTCAAAMDWLHRNSPDYAILDLALQDGPCTDVALELRRRGVGFAVFSGSAQHEAEPVFAEAPWYEKPSDLRELIRDMKTPRQAA